MKLFSDEKVYRLVGENVDNILIFMSFNGHISFVFQMIEFKYENSLVMWTKEKKIVRLFPVDSFFARD